MKKKLYYRENGEELKMPTLIKVELRNILNYVSAKTYSLMAASYMINALNDTINEYIALHNGNDSTDEIK